MSFSFPDFTWVNVKKDFDIKLDAEFDLDWDIDVDKNVDKDIDIDIDVDIDVKDNVAELEGSFENDSFYGDLQAIATTETTDISSQSFTQLQFENVFQSTAVLGQADAFGHDTFTELTVAFEGYDTGSLTTIALISATD